MYQRWFDNNTDTLFEKGMTPKLSRFVISDDPNWESGHHVHDAETELIYVKSGVARLIIDSSNYVAQTGDIVVVDCMPSPPIMRPRQPPIPVLFTDLNFATGMRTRSCRPIPARWFQW